MSKVITSHVTIDAPVDAVWRTLTDLAAYSQWNPFITSAAGTVRRGERLNLTIQPPGGKTMRFQPSVTVVEERRHLEWLGRLLVPGIFDGRHTFVLTPSASGRTLLQQSETFSGVLVPFSGSMLTRTQVGFTTMNEALAARATRLAGHEPRPAH
jgi:hypothetical protein